MIKRLSVITSILLLFVVSKTVNAEDIRKVVSFKSVNNLVDSNFKVTEENLKEFAGTKVFNSDVIVEFLNGSTEKKVVTDNSSLSYLMDNNILTDDVVFSYDKFGEVSSSISGIDYPSAKGSVSKNLFLMTLSKATYGVELSRPLVFNTVASRFIDNDNFILTKPSNVYLPKELTEEEVLDYSLGDNYLYYSPNVYELYFKTLIDKGIVSSSEISDIGYLNQINSYSTKSNGLTVLPSWSKDLGYYNLHSQDNPQGYLVDDVNVLGNSYTLNLTESSGSISYNSYNYFFDNELLVIDALEYIEKALRLTEKDMTKTEAEIINYKYGASHLLDLDEDYKNTVMFLVAKGVLNFEDTEEFVNMYNELDYDFFYELMYRVHNPNARLDFSKIQLTDSDNFFLSQGLYKNNIDFYFGEGPSTETTVTEIKPVATERKLFGFITIKDNPLADGEKSFKVIKIIPTSTYDFFYEGEKLANDGSGFIRLEKDISAKSPEVASAIVDSRITYKQSGSTDGSLFIASVPAVSKIFADKEAVTYVSKATLMANDAFNLVFTEDKYITNADTGARALLLNDNKIAIVGNEIIKVADGVLVYGIAGEVYYNLDIIARLFKDSQLNTLEPNSAYVVKHSSTFTVPVNDVLGSNIASADIEMIGSAYYLDITNNSHMNNYIIQDVSEHFGGEKTIMVVELTYAMAKTDANSLETLVPSTGLTKVPSVAEVYGKVYEKPKTEFLKEWWDSNITFTNSLVNFMMDTEGVSYVKSGLLTPKITFLHEGIAAKYYDSTVIDNFFKTNLNLSESFTKKHGNFISGETFTRNYFRFNNLALTLSSDTSSITSDPSFTTLRYKRTLEFQNGAINTDEGFGYTKYGYYIVTKTGKVLVDVTKYPKYDVSLSMGYSKVPTLLTLVDTIGMEKTTKPLLYSHYKLNSDSNVMVHHKTKEGYSSVITQTVLSYKHSGKAEDGGVSSMAQVSADVANVFSDFDIGPVTSTNFFGFSYPRQGNLFEGRLYRFSNGYFKYSGGDLVKQDVTKIVADTVIYYYPNALIKTSELAVDSKNKLVNVPEHPSYDFTLFNGLSFTSQIMDSIYYNTDSFSTFESIPNGATVYVGGKSYIKKDANLISNIIRDKDKASLLSKVDLKDKANYSSILQDSIGNVTITNITNIYTKSLEGINNYIEDIGIGPGPSEIESPDYTLISKNGVPKVIDPKGKETEFKVGESNIQSYALYFRLNDSLRYRALNSENTVFTLVQVSSGQQSKFMDGIPYYTETLSYSDSIVNGLEVTGLAFEEANDLQGKSDMFFDGLNTITVESVVKLIKSFISNFCLIASVTNIIIVMSSRTSLHKFFQVIREGSRTVKGPDLYRIFSFGIQTVDYDSGFMKISSIIICFLGIMSFLAF